MSDDIVLPTIIPHQTNIITIKAGGKDVELDLSELYTSEDVYVNVTPLFKVWKKEPADYFRTKGWKKIAAAFEERYGKTARRTKTSKNAQVVDSISPGKNAGLEISTTYEGQGTWVHAWLVEQVLRYLSADFSLIVAEGLRRIFADENSRVTTRNYLRIEHGTHSDAVHDYWHRKYNAPPPTTVFQAFFDAGNIGATGMPAHRIKFERQTETTREGLTADETRKLETLLAKGCTLLEANVPFEDVIAFLKKG